MGTRELEDDEVDPSSFEVPREVMNKYGRGPLPPRTQIEADIINFLYCICIYFILFCVLYKK